MSSNTVNVDDNGTVMDSTDTASVGNGGGANTTKDAGEKAASSHRTITWSPENEEILVEWCDIAQCYKWLHMRANQGFSTMHAWFTIPAIVLSTISGTASFAQASLPANLQLYAPMAIGSLNIFIGILTTIQQYLKISELNEAHRVSAIAWDKFARNIRIELAKTPLERMDASHFLKMSRQEFDRLMETSPAVPESTTRMFISTFSGKDGTSRRVQYDELTKPDICNIIESVNHNRHPWYKEYKQMQEIAANAVALGAEMDAQSVSKRVAMTTEEAERKELADRMNNERLQEITRQKNALEKEKEDRRARFQRAVLDSTKRRRDQIEKIELFISNFSRIRGRNPIEEEIQLSMKESIDKDIMLEFLEKYAVDVDSRATMIYTGGPSTPHLHSKSDENNNIVGIAELELELDASNQV